jgi:hypothetical protein
VRLPGGGKLGVYQPRHGRPKAMTVAKTRAKRPARKTAKKTARKAAKRPTARKRR